MCRSCKAVEDDLCTCSGCYADIEKWESAQCTMCDEAFFCEKCEREYTAFGRLLECDKCSRDLGDNLDQYDESVEREQIGYREGDRDLYDNRDDY